jgi:hypothetical protein
MARTQLNSGEQTASQTIVRADVNTTTAGDALITKILVGNTDTTSITYTGADSGTGDVTITIIGTYDIHLTIQGTMTNAEIFRNNATRDFTFPISLTGSYATAGIAATASSVFTLKKNGSSIGTITFATSSSTGTFSFTSAISFSPGDVLEIDGPATADTTLANIGIDLLGTRP